MLTASIAKLLVYALSHPSVCTSFHASLHAQLDVYILYMFRLFLGYVWPAYTCFKALKGKKQDAARFWCHYWCAGCSKDSSNQIHPTRTPRLILALFTAAEHVLDVLVFWCVPSTPPPLLYTSTPMQDPSLPRGQGALCALPLAPQHAGL